MFMVMNPPLKRRKGKKTHKRTRATRKNRGGKSRLAKLLAKFRQSAKHTSFRSMASNRGNSTPLTRRVSSAPFTGVTMKMRHGRGRHVRRNSGMASAKRGILSGLNPKMWVEVVPYAGGAVTTELATMLVSKVIPMTKSGMGNILLSGAMAGVTGALTGALLKNRTVGHKMMIGGVAGVIGKTANAVRSQGMNAFGLHGAFHETFGGTFMGDFVSPLEINNAVQSGPTIAQYSLPNANAQYVPMAPQMVMPQGGSMADYELGAVGAMIDQPDGGGY